MAVEPDSSLTSLRIDSDRMRANFEELRAIGGTPDGGVHRPSFGTEDMKAREWLMDKLKALGLEDVRMDAVGNVRGRLNGGGPDTGAIGMGSHLDTVPCGGAFDGALGVITALEVITVLATSGKPLSRPVEIFGTSEEEGRFGGMMGSQALAGTVTPEWLAAAKDSEGNALVDVMKAAGLPGTAESLPSCKLKDGELGWWFELHIEQGPVLEAADESVGIVTGIAGVLGLDATMKGDANHSGTTPMSMRRDAIRGMGEFVGPGVSRVLDAVGSESSRLTVGYVQVEPNYCHTVPGLVTFNINIRDTTDSAMESLGAEVKKELAKAADAHSLELSIKEQTMLSATPLHKDAIEALQRGASVLGLTPRLMPSGAGHDTQNIVPMGTPGSMVFVKSRGGVSHAPSEHSEWDDIVVGTNVLLQGVVDVLLKTA